MTHILTLISNPARPAVTEALVARLGGALGSVHSVDRLNQEVAADIAFDAKGHPSADIGAAVEAALAGEPVDAFVHTPESLPSRRKRLFLADMDSTMIEQECIDELADYVGLKEEVSTITERAMRGEIAFEPALRERVALLKGLPLRVVDEIIEGRITLMPGGRVLVQTLRAKGVHTCLVSGGFTLFTGPVAARIGFHEHRSNRLVTSDGQMAGRVEEPILGREAKLATLVEMRDRLGLRPEETLAVGDGANDLAMLGAAGLGVAFHAKPAVAAAAHARVDHGDLTALLYLQGYRASDFVSA